MRRIETLLVVLFVFVVVSARGDTLRTFALSDPAGAHSIHVSDGVLSGQVTIDTTTGVALYGNAEFLYYGESNEFLYANSPVKMQVAGSLVNGGCLFQCEEFPNTHQFYMVNANSDGSVYEMYMTTSSSLVNYMGGPLCYQAGCDPDAFTVFSFRNAPYPPFTINGVSYDGGTLPGVLNYFFTANLTLVSGAQAPEPPTLLLMGSGLLVLGIALRRVKRKTHRQV